VPNENLTEIIFCLDRSGSMVSTRSDAEGGFNQFIADQRRDQNGECRVTLCQFDSDGYETVLECVPLDSVPPLRLEPRGNTPLLDAMGRTIQETGKRLANTPENQRPGQVIVVFITDGQENCSRTYNKRQIEEMVQHQEQKYLWRFVYLGSNQDAIHEATNLGFTAHNAMSYGANAKGTRGAYSSLSDNVSKLRRMKSGGVEQIAALNTAMFTPQDYAYQTEEAGVDASINRIVQGTSSKSN